MKKNTPKPRNVWITPEADQEMGRQGNRFMLRVSAFIGAIFLGLYLLYTHVPLSLRYIQSINGVICVLMVVVIMFWFRRMFAVLKEIGRKLYQERKYPEAVQALEPFTHMGSRSFDPDGEAHYLLATIYHKQGEAEKAQKVADFLLRYRSRTPFAKRWIEEQKKSK